MDRVTRVLIVDDEPLVGKRLTPALEKIGCEVEFFADPAAALDRIEASEFDIVITDVCMGEIDGIHVLKTVRRCCPRTKVIIITGYAMMSLAREAMRRGAYDFIAKPFTPDDLREVVRRAEADLPVPVGHAVDDGDP
jgi:DNA-binding NtrC family response regulator